MSDYHSKALADIQRRLAGSPFLAATVQRVSAHAAQIAKELQQAVLADVPQFSASMNPDLLPESARHGVEHIEEILRLLRGGHPDRFEFVKQHARRRAEQHFPLEATLHAYRSGHKVLSRWLREPPSKAAIAAQDLRRDMAAIVDFVIEYTDAISTTFAAAYSSHTVLLADVAGDERAALLQALLDGRDEADPRVARILREAGFPNQRQTFCVALAHSVDPAEMLNAARARRLADSIEQVMADSTTRRLIDVHANKVTMVFSDVRRESGWTAPRRPLAARTCEALQFVGNAALIGVSTEVPSTAHIPAAYREAAIALEFAGVTQRVLQFAAIPLQRLLLHFGRESLQWVLPAWANELYAADRQAGGALSATLRAYAGADMNVLQAAQVLGVHPNTLYARFHRIQELTGLQPRTYEGLTALLVVADCGPARTAVVT